MDWRTSLRIHPIEHVAPRVAYLPDHDFTILTTNGSFAEIVFQVEEPCVITHVGVNVEDGGVAGVGGIAGTYVATLQGVASGGYSDGVIKATTSSYTPDLPDTEIFVWLPLVASYSASRGEEICFRWEKISGGGSSFITRVLGPRFNRGGSPYQRVFTGGGTFFASDIAVYGYRTAARRYGFPLRRIKRNSTNAPGQTGMRFFFSDEIAENAVLSHITWVGKPATSPGQTYAVVVCDDAGVELSRTVVDVDVGSLQMVGAASDRDFSSTVYLDDAPTIEFGRAYFVALEPQSASQGLVVSGWEFHDAADAFCLGGEGEFYLAARSGSSGGFTTDPTIRPMIDLGFFDWGVSAPPQTGYHVKFLPRYNDNALIEHADDQVVDPRETVDGEPHEAPGFPIGGAIKSYGGFATVEVFRNPEGVFDSTTRIFPEQPIEELKMVNWDPFVVGDSHLVFRLRGAEGSSVFVDVDQYARLV